MLNRLSLLALAFSPLLGELGQAQVQTVWNIQTLYSPLPYLFPVEVLPRPDGGVVTVGLGYASQSKLGSGNVVVSALDDQGEKLWTWTALTQPDSATGNLQRAITAAAMDGAGNVYLTYTLQSTSVLVSLDPNGVQRWQETLGGSGASGGFAVTSLGVTPAGDVRVAAFSLDSTTWPGMKVDAFDSGGARLWAWRGTVNQGTPGIPFGVEVLPNGDTYVYGTNDGLGFSQYRKNYAMLLDASGQLAWYDDLATNAGSLAYQRSDLAPNGDLVVALIGSVSNWPNTDPVRDLRRYRPDGTIVMNADLDGLLSMPWATLRDLKVAPNGDTLLGFSDMNEVLRISGSGVVLPSWILPTADDEVLAIRPTDDGGAIVAAARETGASSDTLDIRFDAQGQIVWSQRRGGVLSNGLDDYYPSRTDMDVTIGARGNIFTSNATQNPAVVGQRSGVVKLIEGPELGTAYCQPAVANSTGVAATLTGLGSDARGSDNLSLLASNLPVGAFVLFLVSDQAGFVAQPGGSQGNLCLGGSIGRYLGANELRRARGAGTAYLQLALDAIPRVSGFQSAMAGETWRFQAYYRDSVGGAPVTNFTEGLEVLLR